ncbi:MAG: hypothetical protein ACRYG7_09150 [Janthinobacterium lividum]
MDNLTALKSTLCELAAKQNENFDSLLFAAQVQEAMENCGFDDSTRVPDWLVLFFEALLTRKTIPKSPYLYDKTAQGDVSNFLAELEDILHLQWKDAGEQVELVADKLKTFGIISIEDDTYQVGGLAA